MNWPFKNKLAVGKMTLSVKGVMMSKYISVMVLCILALFLSSCIPNYLTYRKSGIYAECRLSSSQGCTSVETLSENCVFTYLGINYEGKAEQNPELSYVNLLLGGKSLNLATVKYEDVEGITPGRPCIKRVEKNDFDKDNPFYQVAFQFIEDGVKEERLVLIHFQFDKDKNIKWFHCICSTNQKTGCVAFENTVNKAVFEPPFKVDELKTLFGADAHISKSYSLK